MTAKQYQANLIPQVKNRFPGVEVINEWAAFTGLAYQYSPRVDIAVGPFSTAPGQTLIREYNEIVSARNVSRFLKGAYDFHNQNSDPLLYSELERVRFDWVISKNQN